MPNIIFIERKIVTPCLHIVPMIHSAWQMQINNLNGCHDMYKGQR